MQLQSFPLFRKILSPLVVLFALAILPAGAAPTRTVAARPCDLLASATPCVAAISTTRALYRTYTGPLYQVTRESDKDHTDSRPITTTSRLRLPAVHPAVPAPAAMTSPL